MSVVASCCLKNNCYITNINHASPTDSWYYNKNRIIKIRKYIPKVLR